MNLLKFILLCSASGFLLVLFNCKQKEKDVIVLTENLPPLNYIYQDSALGFSCEIVREMLSRAGIPARIEFSSWSDAYQTALNRPNTLIFSIARTEERESSFIWIGRISLEETAIYARGDSKIELQTFEDLDKHRFSVMKDSYFHEYLVEKGVEVNKESQLGTLEDMINKLKLGKTDLIVGNHSCVNYAIRSMGYYLSDFEEVMTIPELQRDFYVAISRNSNKDLIISLKEAFEQMSSSEFNARIIDKYIKEQ